MASAAHIRRLRFAVELRKALDDQGQSVRGLARTLNPDSPETARSNLSRWLRGAHVPSRSSRRKVAVALRLPADYFGDDADEEEDPVAVLMQAIEQYVNAKVDARDAARVAA